MIKIFTVVIILSTILSCQKKDEKHVIKSKVSDTVLSTPIKPTAIKTKNDSKDIKASVSLPFDFENYQKTCFTGNPSECQQKYPTLATSEYDKIMKIIGTKDGQPESIFSIQSTIETSFDIYVLYYEGDSSLQDIITVNKDKIISHQSIGYAMPENETYDTFIINPDMTIDIYEVSYADNSRKKKEKYRISAEGNISKI